MGWRVVVLIVLSMSVVACGALPKEARDVEWNADPSAVIVMVYSLMVQIPGLDVGQPPRR